MIKQYQASYRDADGQDQKLDLLAYDLRRAHLSAAELIPVSATLLRVNHNPDWS